MLEYRVISSHGFNVYKVKFEGQGKDLKVSCNCPAGKNGKLFCKHISNLINSDKSNILQPSDNIESLKDVLANSLLLVKHEEYLKKLEENEFIYNNVRICNIDDLYNYIKNIIEKNIIIENNQEMKRLALYKAEYYKNGNPKHIIKNRIIYMEYNDELTRFNFDHCFYTHFAHAGLDFIESIENILNNDFSNLGIFAYKALFSDGYITGPFISKYNDLNMICNRVVVLLMSHYDHNNIGENIYVKNVYEIQMQNDNDQSYYVVPHKIINTYSEHDFKEIINKK
jgi:hypothetical protein